MFFTRMKRLEDFCTEMPHLLTQLQNKMYLGYALHDIKVYVCLCLKLSKFFEKS